MSTVSFFEMTIKASLGKLQFDPSVLDQLDAMGIELLPLDSHSFKEYKVFNPANRDPFDNMLIATARAHDAALVTSDEKILDLGDEYCGVFDARQ